MERRPQQLAPHFDTFAALLDHPNRLIQWQAIQTLSHLARTDVGHRLASVFPRYFRPIKGPVMITAANVIQGGARIAAARPQWADRIAREIRGVSAARYRSAECRRIAIGHAILAMEELFPFLRDRESAVRFVRSQVRCSRPATRAKAEKFLKRRVAYTSPTN